MDKIHIFCFAGCYILAIATELYRRWKCTDESDDSTASLRLSGWSLFLITVGFTMAGLIAQTIYLSFRVNFEQGITPLSSSQGSLLSASWLLSIVYLASLKRNNYTVFPVMILIVSVILIGSGGLFASGEPFSRLPVMQAWGIIHGISQITFFVSLVVGLIIGLLYLIQDRRLKQKLDPGSMKLPSLEWLARTNRASLIWALVAMAPGIFSGVILLHARKTPSSMAEYLFDPTILGSTIIFLWILWTVIRSSVFGAFSEAKATARRTIFLFLLLSLTLTTAYFSPTGHLRENKEPVKTEVNAEPIQEMRK